MAIFDVLNSNGESRRSSYDKPESWFLNSFGSLFGRAKSGINVTPERAMGSAVFLACVRVISEDLAKLPLNLYETSEDGSRALATKHHLFRLLRKKPNRFQTAYEFKLFMQVCVLMRGNAFAFIDIDEDGNPIELTPKLPDKTTVLVTDDNDLFYDFNDGNPPVPSEHVLHIKGMSFNGHIGVSLVDLMRETLGLDLASQEHSAAFFGNGAFPGVVLKTDKKISKEAKDKMKADWHDHYNGSDKSSRTAVLSEGFQIEQIKLSHVDAQFLENKTLTAYQICGFCRVSPHLAGVMDKATYSNIEHQGQNHANNAIAPWATLWEENLEDKLLLSDEVDAFSFEFSFDAMIRPDFKTRMEGYEKGINASVLSPNECRSKEGLNKRKDQYGDKYRTPLNIGFDGEGEQVED